MNRACLLALLLAACTPAGTTSGAAPVRPSEGEREPATQAQARQKPPRNPPEPEPPPLDTHVAFLEPSVLAALEAKGFGLAPLVVGSELRTTAELNGHSGFRTLFDVLRSDLRRAKQSHPLAKVTSMDGFRLFDARWLSSKEMAFELVGVFNRMDRRVLYDASCGEIRFVYRLRYSTEHGGAPMASRLPLTLNVVYLVDEEGDCQAAAKAWQTSPGLDASESAAWLVGEGPLSARWRERWSLKSVEVNLQSFRIQSRALTTLAGHVDYILRVFMPQGRSTDAFAPGPMHNLPDVTKLERDAELRAELLAHLKAPESLEAIDLGIHRVPEKFLATRALSVAPRGLARPANRPYRALFKEDDFADVELGGYRTIRSPAALLRRLDVDSCPGCHQSRSIAGAHHVGLDRAETPVFNALWRGSSTHLLGDIERRRDYVAALAAGDAPDEHRPFPERQGTGAGHGAPCGLGDPGFRDWACGEGYSCVRLEDTEVGSCFERGAIGTPCEYGTLYPGVTPFRDRVRLVKHGCGDGQSCDPNDSGFAQGSCSSNCSAKLPGSVCGDFTEADGLQNCLRHDRSLEDCAKEFVFQTGLRACDAENPCRQDYVCARTNAPDVGACVPPYFVYQLRLDGYPLER